MNPDPVAKRWPSDLTTTDEIPLEAHPTQAASTAWWAATQQGRDVGVFRYLACPGDHTQFHGADILLGYRTAATATAIGIAWLGSPTWSVLSLPLGEYRFPGGGLPLMYCRYNPVVLTCDADVEIVYGMVVAPAHDRLNRGAAYYWGMVHPDGVHTLACASWAGTLVIDDSGASEMGNGEFDRKMIARCRRC